MSTINSLEGPKLRIERANAHINELIPLIRSFCEGQRYTSWVDVNPNGNRVIKVKIDPAPVPQLISVVAGEVLFLLRSSFDHMACALAIQNGATKTNDVYFPTGRDIEHFVAQAKEKIHRLSSDAKGMIAALEPYDGGRGHWIRVLHSINLIDKHQSLIPAAAATFSTMASLSFKPQLGLNTIIAPKVIPAFENEIVIAELPAGAAEIQGNLNVSIDIAFGDIETVKGKPVLPSLMEFSDLTKGIVLAIEGQFFA